MNSGTDVKPDWPRQEGIPFRCFRGKLSMIPVILRQCHCQHFHEAASHVMFSIYNTSKTTFYNLQVKIWGFIRRRRMPSSPELWNREKQEAWIPWFCSCPQAGDGTIKNYKNILWKWSQRGGSWLYERILHWMSMKRFIYGSLNARRIFRG